MVPGLRARTLAATLAAALLCALAPAAAPAARWTPYGRPATNGLVTQKDVKVRMSDGALLAANVSRPDKPGRYPVIITQTPYGKEGALAGVNAFLVKRGYVHVVVDVRGTGASEGQWDSFGPREQRDGPEVVAWSRRQTWSNGRVGLYGPSYMAITQLTTAARRPPGLKAIFPIVPMGDSYRDITFSGGQVNVSFIPLWLGLVTGSSLTPNAFALDGGPAELVQSLNVLASHALGVRSFQLNTVINAMTGGNLAFDGPFWAVRSPLELVDRIRGAGVHRRRPPRPLPARRAARVRAPQEPCPGAPAHGTLDTPHRLAGRGAPARRSAVARCDRAAMVRPLPQGDRHPRRPDPARDAVHLRSRALRGPGRLAQPAARSRAPLPARKREAVAERASRARAGAPLRAAAALRRVYAEHESVERGAHRADPMHERQPAKRADGRDLHHGTPEPADAAQRTRDREPVGVDHRPRCGSERAGIRRRAERPSRELTGGWLAASFRALDGRRSRFVRGRLVQPWHPFTRRSVLGVPAGKPMKLAVEVFPLNAVIKPGHRLRIAVGPSDFPHAVPPAPQLGRTLGGVVRVLSGPRNPSQVILPTAGTTCARTGRAPRRGAGCPRLPVAPLVRGG